MTDRVEEIRRRLADAFQPEALEIEDESHLHAGHAGARDGRGHYRVCLVAEAFAGLNRLQRHRRVYEALGSLMQTDIHALALELYSPEEI